MDNEFHANEAIDLIKTGLQSNAIKLLGTQNANPAGAGEKDAEYLLTLYVQLQKGLQNQQG